MDINIMDDINITYYKVVEISNLLMSSVHKLVPRHSGSNNYSDGNLYQFCLFSHLNS